MYSPHVSNSTSTVNVTTSASTTTTVTVSRVSQPKSAAGQHQPGSFVGLSTTLHTRESRQIPTDYPQQAGLRLLAEVSTSQINPFEAIATFQTLTFDGEGVRTGIRGVPNLPSDQYQAKQNPALTDNWIILDKSKGRPYQCGYPGCNKDYLKKSHLTAHFVKHNCTSKFKCPYPECVGNEYFRDSAVLKRHIAKAHLRIKLFQCDRCDKRFMRNEGLKYHMAHLHCLKAMKKSPKLQSISESSSDKTRASANTANTSTMTSRVSQPELAVGQRQQGPYVGISTTIDTLESMQIAIYHQQTATFDDEAVTTGIAGVHNLPSDQYQVEQSPDPTATNKWIIVDKSQGRPYQCGYPGCDKNYLKRCHLTGHLVKHNGTSEFKCPYPECVGNGYFRDRGMLKRHIASKHIFDKPFQCDRCDRRYGRKDQFQYHRKHAHSPNAKKKPGKSQSVSKSSSATTIANTASTSTMTFRVSQPELAAGQRQQGSFVDLSKTVYKPEPTIIPATYYQRNELGLLSGISVSDLSSSQFDPFEILATHQSVTFEDQNQFQEQLDVFPLPFDELLQPIDDFDLVVSEAPDDVNLSILSNKNDERISNRTTISIPERKSLPPNNDHFRQALTGIKPEAVGITGDPNLPNSQHQAYQRPETDKWIILTGDKKRPFQCGYEDCGRKYSKKGNLQTHFITHTGDSPYRCYMAKCTGEVAFSRQRELIWHIRFEHKVERPHQCEVCGRRFIRPACLRDHRRKLHSKENEKKSPKRKKK